MTTIYTAYFKTHDNGNININDMGALGLRINGSDLEIWIFDNPNAYQIYWSISNITMVNSSANYTPNLYLTWQPNTDPSWNKTTSKPSNGTWINL